MSIVDFAQGGPPPGDPMAAMGAAPDMGMAPPEEAAPEESTLDILNRMIEDAKLYMEIDPDEEDKLTMAKVLTMLQGYLAAEQKEAQDAMQGKLSPKILSQAYGG